MKKTINLSVAILIGLIFVIAMFWYFAVFMNSDKGIKASKTLVLFVGSATQPATKEVAKLFEDKYGVRVELHFGGSGAMLSQMMITQRGDIYFPGSSDFMERAKKENIIVSNTERIVVYLIPAINVQKGNPKKILTLRDLTRPDIKIAIANPNTVCVGLYAAEIIEKAGLTKEILPKIATYAESCSKTARLVALRNVDAVLGWRVFQYWSPETTETILLKPEEIPRIGYVPIAISKFCKQQELAQKFIDFVTSKEGKDIYSKWSYLTKIEDARKFVSPTATIGGEWQLPETWR